MAKKVFVSGWYDMLHSGHVEFFRQAAQYGDLYVALALQPHSLYRPSGCDLYLDLPLAPCEAALGAEGMSTQFAEPAGQDDSQVCHIEYFAEVSGLSTDEIEDLASIGLIATVSPWPSRWCSRSANYGPN